MASYYEFAQRSPQHLAEVIAAFLAAAIRGPLEAGESLAELQERLGTEDEVGLLQLVDGFAAIVAEERDGDGEAGHLAGALAGLRAGGSTDTAAVAEFTLCYAVALLTSMAGAGTGAAQVLIRMTMGLDALREETAKIAADPAAWRRRVKTRKTPDGAYGISVTGMGAGPLEEAVARLARGGSYPADAAGAPEWDGAAEDPAAVAEFTLNYLAHLLMALAERGDGPLVLLAELAGKPDDFRDQVAGLAADPDVWKMRLEVRDLGGAVAIGSSDGSGDALQAAVEGGRLYSVAGGGSRIEKVPDPEAAMAAGAGAVTLFEFARRSPAHMAEVAAMLLSGALQGSAELGDKVGDMQKRLGLGAGDEVGASGFIGFAESQLAKVMTDSPAGDMAGILAAFAAHRAGAPGGGAATVFDEASGSPAALAQLALNYARSHLMTMASLGYDAPKMLAALAAREDVFKDQLIGMLAGPADGPAEDSASRAGLNMRRFTKDVVAFGAAGMDDEALAAAISAGNVEVFAPDGNRTATLGGISAEAEAAGRAEMESLRALLEGAGIGWEDKSEEYPIAGGYKLFINRTYWGIGGNLVSTIFGTGTYGSEHGLLESLMPGKDGPVGSLTAQEVFEAWTGAGGEAGDG